MTPIYHIPAMLHETVAGLNIQPDGVYVDVTFGGGGHSRAILEKLNGHGRLLSFDQDIDAYLNAQQTPLINDQRWQFIHGNFRYLRNFLDYYGITQIDGLLADLGVSFHHFDEAERGFSFRFAGALDMRMNRNGGMTAADILNNYPEPEIAQILYIYGELKNARQIAQRIVHYRETTPITQTEQLVQLYLGNNTCTITNGEIDVPTWAKKDLAKLFQALRIEVNDELRALQDMLLAAQQLLRVGGRIAILTYHSLEDRIVKNFLRAGNFEGNIQKDFYGNALTPFRILEKGATASQEEITANPRARSAKLRVAEKMQDNRTSVAEYITK